MKGPEVVTVDPLLKVWCSALSSDSCSTLKCCPVLGDSMLEADSEFCAALGAVLKAMVIFGLNNGRFGELYIFALKKPPLHRTEGETA